MANLLPLILSVKAKRWRQDDDQSGSADGEFRTVRLAALERDRNTCRFCGFMCKPSRTLPKANYYMQVHHKDDDHHNNTLANLVTACMHCHAVQHIGMWGLAGEADVIWLPEIDQATLNHMCRTVLVAQRYADLLPTGTPKENDEKKSAMVYADVAREWFARVQSRTEEAKQRWRTSSPSDLGNVMIMMPPEAYNARVDSLRGARLLLTGRHNMDNGDIMLLIVDSWLAEGGPYYGYKPKTWTALIKDLPQLS